MVTDPEVSKALYEQASSLDKTIKLYPGMWHGLTSGEPDDNIKIVFGDIIAWLEKHSKERDHDRTVSIQSPSPLSYPSNSIERLAASATMGPQRTPRRQTSSSGSYLCGLKGRRLLQQSAM